MAHLRMIILALLCLIVPSGNSAQPAGSGDDGIAAPADPPEIADAAALPPYCSEREHLGVPGYLVDQAWVAYRRIERSSPLRKGWCSCAKRCEPIDFLAARYERTAFAANELAHDPDVPPEQRAEYGRLATEMFAARNQTVVQFRGCIDRTRPPLSPPGAVPRKEPLKCIVTDALPIKQRWAIWCEQYMKKWQLIRNDYVAAFGGKNAYLSFYTTLSKVMQNGQLVWVLGHGRYQSQNMTAAQAKDYLKRLLAIPLPVVPPDASRTF